MPDPDASAMFDIVYAEQTPLLQQQQDAFRTYLAGFSEGAHA
jgi:hypothetical protein